MITISEKTIQELHKVKMEQVEAMVKLKKKHDTMYFVMGLVIGVMVSFLVASPPIW